MFSLLHKIVLNDNFVDAQMIMQATPTKKKLVDFSFLNFVGDTIVQNLTRFG